MKQSNFDLNLSTRQTCKQAFLQQMETVVTWAALVDLIAPYYCEGRNGRLPFALETMLRVHFMQQGFNLSDLAMEEAFIDAPLYGEFAQLDAFGLKHPGNLDLTPKGFIMWSSGGTGCVMWRFVDAL